MDSVYRRLVETDWDFPDYNRRKYPLNMNSVPWYLATFIPPIPKLLIALLSSPGDTVLDPFGGQGTTAIESVKQCRIPIYNDLNPFAADMAQGMLKAIEVTEGRHERFVNEANLLEKCAVPVDVNVSQAMEESGVSSDAESWYEHGTLLELLGIVNLINSNRDDPDLYCVRKLALTSVLKASSSQPGHFTYVTDNCRPKVLKRKNAKELYLGKLDQIVMACDEMAKQFCYLHPEDDILRYIREATVLSEDARCLSRVENGRVDLVVTSPPYPCSQDYIKTMRLINMFFPNEKGFNETYRLEIGSRRLRKHKPEDVARSYHEDMYLAIREIDRVLAEDGYLALVIGEGRSKAVGGYDSVGDVRDIAKLSFGFEEVYCGERRISDRDIHIGGVDKESVIVFKKGD